MKKILTICSLSLLLLAGCKKEESGDKLNAEFTINNSDATVKEGDAVLISIAAASGSSSCHDHAMTYHWDLGNGKTCDSKIPSFHYGMHGTYNITLTLTDDRGRTKTCTRTIKVLCIFIDPNHAPLI
jgi:PKD repeat protein